mmetsp:Transcript_22128/g.34830  ORF Transcript_22128/g.34830 Transcript_22128/m.34830 type:complete len:123 (+) Transcript_22128:61-429(+)
MRQKGRGRKRSQSSVVLVSNLRLFSHWLLIRGHFKCQPPWKIVQPHLRLPHPHYHKWPLHSGDINPALISHPRIHIHNRMHTPLNATQLSTHEHYAGRLGWEEGSRDGGSLRHPPTIRRADR